MQRVLCWSSMRSSGAKGMGAEGDCATGIVLELDARLTCGRAGRSCCGGVPRDPPLEPLPCPRRIMKKLKLVGTPFKVHRHTAFVSGMFTSQLETAKFEGGWLMRSTAVHFLSPCPFPLSPPSQSSTYQSLYKRCPPLASSPPSPSLRCQHPHSQRHPRHH